MAEHKIKVRDIDGGIHHYTVEAENLDEAIDLLEQEELEDDDEILEAYGTD